MFGGIIEVPLTSALLLSLLCYIAGTALSNSPRRCLAAFSVGCGCRPPMASQYLRPTSRVLLGPRFLNVYDVVGDVDVDHPVG